jgi:hypothetical protein
MGGRTLENEEVVCPNHNDSANWIPCAYDEFVKVGSHRNCSTDIHRARGRGITKHADLLRCVDPSSGYCVWNRRYVIGRAGQDVNTTALDNGMYRTQFIDVANVTSIDVEYPFWALARLFIVEDDWVPNDWYNCGYYAFPYATLEAVRRRAWDLFDNFKVSDIHVEFTQGSFARAPPVKGKNLTLLEKSTFTVRPPTFDGPIPFDWIYQ